MYYYNPSGKEGHQAALTSPEFESPTSAKLSFFYHINSADIGSLFVNYVSNGTRTALITKQDSMGSNWFYACTSISSDMVMSLEFIAVRGSAGNGDIAIDDVLVDSGTCPCEFFF